MVINAYKNMADLLKSKIDDPDSTTSSILDATTTIAFCVGNLMSAAGDSARAYGEQSPKDSGHDRKSAQESVRFSYKHVTCYTGRHSCFKGRSHIV